MFRERAGNRALAACSRSVDGNDEPLARPVPSSEIPIQAGALTGRIAYGKARARTLPPFRGHLNLTGVRPTW